MGWRELNAWIAAMSRAKEEKLPSPDSWAGADGSAHWAELRAARDRWKTGG